MSNVLIRTNRDYRLLLSASSASNLADGVGLVALPWLATMLTRDPILIAGVATAQRLPWLVFALPAGVWTDRADRRLLMVRADLVRVVLMAFTVLMVISQSALPVPDGSGPLAILSLMLIAFLFGSAEVIRDNAAQTILPSIVAQEDLERANGQMWSAEQITGQFVGPPVAGVLIASSVALPFGINATVYSLSALLIWLIALPPRKAAFASHFLPALLEGMGWMWRNPLILRLAIMLGAINARVHRWHDSSGSLCAGGSEPVRNRIRAAADVCRDGRCCGWSSRAYFGAMVGHEAQPYRSTWRIRRHQPYSWFVQLAGDGWHCPVLRGSGRNAVERGYGQLSPAPDP